MKLKAYSLSFILHFLLLVMILFFASTFNKEQKIIEVNLNIEDFRIEKPSTKEEIKGQEKHSYKSMPEKLKANQSQTITSTGGLGKRCATFLTVSKASLSKRS